MGMIVFLAGLALTTGCLLDSLNVVRDLSDPPALLLKFYTASALFV